jgi:hypothetical protein
MRQSADAKLCSNTRSIIIIFNYALQSFKAYYAFHLSPPGVSTRVTKRENPAAEGVTVGEKFPGILPKCRLPRHIYGSFTCRKATTWNRRL